MVPSWIITEQWKDLKPPADILALGKVRSAENLLKITEVLCVLAAPRYKPGVVTYCNIFTSDTMAIMGAPLPHWFDLGDGQGRREMTANLTHEGLRKNKFPGWKVIEVPTALKLTNRTACGLPTVAVWTNPKGPGHIMPLVPTPAGKVGAYVTGAGRTNLLREPIVKGFGSHLKDCEFYGAD